MHPPITARCYPVDDTVAILGVSHQTPDVVGCLVVGDPPGAQIADSIRCNVTQIVIDLSIPDDWRRSHPPPQPDGNSFHSRTVPSWPAETMREPSGENAALETEPVCPLNGSAAWVPSSFHSRTVPSVLAETI